MTTESIPAWPCDPQLVPELVGTADTIELHGRRYRPTALWEGGVEVRGGLPEAKAALLDKVAASFPDGLAGRRLALRDLNASAYSGTTHLGCEVIELCPVADAEALSDGEQRAMAGRLGEVRLRSRAEVVRDLRAHWLANPNDLVSEALLLALGEDNQL